MPILVSKVSPQSPVSGGNSYTSQTRATFMYKLYALVVLSALCT